MAEREGGSPLRSEVKRTLVLSHAPSQVHPAVSEMAARALGRTFPRRFAPMLHDPVFFIGSGRSGTNLLASFLRSHPEISVFPGEANDLWHPALYRGRSWTSRPSGQTVAHSHARRS